MSVESIFIGLACCAIGWTLLPLLRHDGWWVRVFDFPRVQITTLSVAILVGYITLPGLHGLADYALVLVLFGCIVSQLAQIAPYTPLHAKEVLSARSSAPDDRLSILVANVLTTNRNADVLLGIIRDFDPDLVLAVETDCWWESQLDSLESDYPYTVKHPLDNMYGMHLYSRLALIAPRIEFLVEDDVPSIHTEVVLRSGHRTVLHCLHPAPPSPTEKSTSAERDGELLAVGKRVGGSSRSTVVTGDLNDVAWSATTRVFRRISGLLDPRVGRGVYSTFPAAVPFLRWPLDHLFCSSDFTLVTLARLRRFGSDHFPIGVVLCHAPAAKDIQPEPTPDPEDHQWADEKIDKVDADEGALR